jgi:hypothetical protein
VYAYNDKGLVSSIKTVQHGRIHPIEEWKFEYDEMGNLLQKHVYRDGQFITDIQIVYNSKSNLMTAVLTREVKTDFIMIVRFQEYRYF